MGLSIFKINRFKIHLLDGSSMEGKNTIYVLVEGLHIWFSFQSGWLSELCKDREEIRRHWSQIPVDTDILLTHGPPYCILDKSTRTPNMGCTELLRCITTIVRPRLHVFGHVHGGHGQYCDDEMGRTLFVNASICDRRFRATQLPIIVDLQK